MAEPGSDRQGGVVLQAQKEGRPIIVLRRYEGARGAVVECDVFPVGAMQIEPLRPGPYVFRTPDLAARFVDEVVLALEYLGCTIG